MKGSKSGTNERKSRPSETPKSRSDAERRLRQADRLSRILRLLQLLLSRGRWTRHDIAAEQECSERTVYRDLQVLQLAGIPFELDASGFYRVRQDFRFPSFPLTEEEAIGQGVAAGITSSAALKIGMGAGPLSRKVSSARSDEVTQLMLDAEHLVGVIDLKLAGHSKHRDLIRTVQWALVKKRLLIGTYRSPYEEHEVKLRLHPFRLCLVKQAWYLVAKPVDSDQPRTLRVGRFKVLTMTDTAAEVPRDFNLKEYFGNAWAVYRDDKPYAVEVRFSKDVSATVTEYTWHHTQKVKKCKDGSVLLSFTVDGLNEIVRWVLGWGSNAEVVRPDELRQLVIGQLLGSIKVYQP